ncbi:transcriptional regulator family: Fungal Specific TF [Paecilomyces variotii]|nr:transcriptional regulator family: Fungal Specific TF [Paecilomyces variotii]
MDKQTSEKPKRSDTRKGPIAPPVKLACLAWRSRIRCDGKEICTNCLRKGQECAYTPSRRGGARTSRRFTQNGMQKKNENKQARLLPIEQYIEPGAGLSNLDDNFQDSDLIFDSIFHHDQDAIMSDFQPLRPVSPVVRAYQSDRDVLEAYYVYIHPYFPILPPPKSIPTDRPIAVSEGEQNLNNADYEPSSPLSLAILSILSLIPHPDDPNPGSEEAVLFRRNYAECLAQSALESINIETEVPASSTSPAQVLSEASDVYQRVPFHQHVPVELESIIALSILSIYEYAQRGNIKRMRQRAGQAIMAAMDMCLHSEPEMEKPDEFTEARRRAWWMTYICVCQGSIVSVTEPTISIHDPRFTTPYPTIGADSTAWSFFIDTQRAIVSATVAVVELNKALKAGTGLQSKLEHNRELDNEMKLLAAKADAYLPPHRSTSLLDPEESIVADCLKLIGRIKVNSARIKLHRYSAFFDLPLFSQKHCDLQPSKMREDGSGSGKSPICLCSTSTASLPLPPGLSWKDMSLPDTPSSLASDIGLGVRDLLGLGNQMSTKICLKSALNIAQCFDRLPYPNPYGSLGASISLTSRNPAWNTALPRTMPSFACCAMQSGYSMLMVRHKVELMHPKNSTANPTVAKLYIQLHEGLQSVVGALENYSVAFEALTGMRDQIKMMIGSFDPPSER